VTSRLFSPVLRKNRSRDQNNGAMSKDEALAQHCAVLEQARALIATHDGIRHELAEALRLKAVADAATDANWCAIGAGDDATQTQAALEDAVQALSQFHGGRWLALFWFLAFPFEDLVHEQYTHH
jgi:hypothetical protein